ncbi:uncharacterized protein IUM83_18622 [Phytophthora cinnamomi]|uniref:uncharacterized protein n=1 Tax=Phytophthora cinnamomi TaxID=4785 RepID=UPI00355AA3B4|nr:hypothetical protein IUM83_18622 [Phytophthora cinnamomi]
MWLGGKAAKHATSSARDSSGQEDPATLLEKDRSHYDRVLARSLDPTTIDVDGYASFPELLEQAQLIDLTRKMHQRLTDKAFARIKLDVANNSPPVSSRISNRSSGPREALLSDATLRTTQLEVAKFLVAQKKVSKYDEKPFKSSQLGDYHSDFENGNGFTVLSPTPPFHLPSPEPSEDGGTDVLARSARPKHAAPMMSAMSAVGG